MIIVSWSWLLFSLFYTVSFPLPPTNKGFEYFGRKVNLFIKLVFVKCILYSHAHA